MTDKTAADILGEDYRTAVSAILGRTPERALRGLTVGGFLKRPGDIAVPAEKRAKEQAVLDAAVERDTYPGYTAVLIRYDAALAAYRASLTPKPTTCPENEPGPARDETEEPRGLYPKFKRIERADGSPKHKDCAYFVLDLTHDAEAREATRYYAGLVMDRNPQLAIDLRKVLYDWKPTPITCRADELRKGDVFTDPMGEWTMLADPEPDEPGVVAVFVATPRGNGGRYVTVRTYGPGDRPLHLVSRAKDGDRNE